MSAEPSPQEAPVRRRRWWSDWRVWFGVAVSLISIWYVLRDVPLEEVRASMADANVLLLFGISFPSYAINVYLRALRWRHLTNPIAPISRGLLFRAQAIGFMVNNIIPLRVGEIVRSWYLARESRTSGAAILGTVVLERVIDIVSVPAVAGLGFLLMDVSGAAGEAGGDFAKAWKILLPLGLLPLVGLILLRVAPAPLIGLGRAVVHPFSPRLADWAENMVRRFSDGLGALSGGRHLFWIVFHSALIWLVASTLPVVAAMYAFGIDLGSPLQTLVACWILLSATGVAVALPSTPGFFGVYQVPYREVLTRFGVDPAVALGVGLVVWAVFWVSLTTLGLIVMRASHASLGELTPPPGKDPSPEGR